jgi:hypothetical protein
MSLQCYNTYSAIMGVIGQTVTECGYKIGSYFKGLPFCLRRSKTSGKTVRLW